MQILIVDDSKAMRLIVMRTLRQAGFDGHTLLEATNGKEALGLIRTAPPGLVLSDWHMPEMTGMELLKALRAEGNQVKFGFVTSDGASEMRALASEAGAAFLICKPFTADAFKAALTPFIV